MNNNLIKTVDCYIKNTPRKGYVKDLKINICEIPNKLKISVFFFLTLLIFLFFVPVSIFASDFGYGSMGGYYTLSEVYDQLDNMYSKYPDLITEKQQIGTTIEGRPIYAVKISDNPNSDENEPEVFYNSLTHAREPMGMEVVIYYMYHLLENYNTDSTIKYLVDNREMWFVPVVNPDGYYYNETTNPDGGGNWRKNRRDNGDGTYGVDLNRNFGPLSYWDYSEGGSSTTTSSNTYRGTAPFSEPETQAIRDFIASHYIKTSMSYHSYFGVQLYPYAIGGNITLTDESIFREWAIDLVKTSNYNIGDALDTMAIYANGTTLDYLYNGDIEANHGKIYSFTPEIGVTSHWPTESQIDIIPAENLLPNKYIAFVAGGYVDFISSTLSDDYIDPAENIGVNITVKNKGLGTMGETTATLTTTSPYITIKNGNKTVNSLTSQESLTINSAFDFTVSETAPLGQQLNFTLTISDGGTTINSHTLTYYIATPEIIFSDDCNNLNNWTTQSTQDTVWETTTESYHSAPSSCTDSKNSNYTRLTNPLNNAIISKTIDLTNHSSPKLSFWMKYEINPYSDYVRVRVSNDDGNTWTTLTGQYSKTKTLYYDTIAPIYTGYQDIWVKEEIDLSEYTGGEIKIKFLMSSYLQLPNLASSFLAFYARDGIYIDDIKVFEYDATKSDIINPLSNWTNSDGDNIKFSGSNGDNIYTLDSLPTFTFSKSSDATAGISSYEVWVKPERGNYYPYITGISDGASGTEIDTTERYTKYIGNEITVFSKKETDRLTSGAYRWKVKVFDNNGNNIDTDFKILRINTHTANFSGKWFPLVLLSKKVTNSTPTFTGISTVGSKVTVNLTQNNITKYLKETTVTPNSRFNLTFENKLPTGTYLVNIFATNKNGDYTEITEFDLKIAKPTIKTPSPVFEITTTSKSTDSVLPNTSPTAKPTPIPKTKHCFLWWCW